MRMIISPAKKMNAKEEVLPWQNLPVFLDRTETILKWMQSLSLEEVKELWHCNDKLAQQNYERFRDMQLDHNLTPAILSYEGIQYQYMTPAVFDTSMLSYIQENLRILSGFYGVLRPMDGVTPYRLEMQAKTVINGINGLYDFWGSSLYEEVVDDSHVIVNLASKEYAKCIEPYLKPEDRFISCVFGELSGGKVVQKGVYAKMTRGEMVRFMAEKRLKKKKKMKAFDRLGYQFCEERSTESEFVFLK